MSETLVAHTDPVTGETVMLPPASGAVIDIAPRRDGQGGVGSAGEGYSVGSGRGAGVGAAGPVPVKPPASAPMEAPQAVGATAPEAIFGGSADRVTSAWEQRWLARQGIGAPAMPPQAAPRGDGTEMRAQPDPAGFDAIRSPTEPRRGTLRLSPNGTPQMPEGMPLPPRPPEPAQASAPLGEQLSGMVRDTFMATAQGYSEGALATAQAVADAEIQRRLAPTFNDDGPAVERLRAARERAAEMGIDIAFRARPDGAVEAVRVTPEMQTPGGAAGRFADGLGRLLGLAFVDPMGGAAVLGARGAGNGPRGVATTGAASSGGVGASAGIGQQAGRTVKDSDRAAGVAMSSERFNSPRQVRAAASAIQDALRADGYRVVRVDSSSVGGASSYLEVSDPTTGLTKGSRIRISDHSIGANRDARDRDFHVGSDADIPFALDWARSLRAPENVERARARAAEIQAAKDAEAAQAADRRARQQAAENAAAAEWRAVAAAFPTEWAASVEGAQTETRRQKAQRELRDRFRAQQSSSGLRSSAGSSDE
jgi:hypothetical protein